MDRFLVTGGAGFIGTNLTRRLVADGKIVRVLDNFDSGKRENLEDLADKVEIIDGDLRDLETVRRVVKDIDVILHQGAVGSVPRSVDDPAVTHAVNVDGTFNVLFAAKDAAVKRVVYAASSSAYGDNPDMPKVETMVAQPISPYAASKLMGEHYCRAFSAVYGLETISLRYFNVFGPYQSPDTPYAAAIPLFVAAIQKGESPIVFGDGEQSRDFNFIENVVEANLLAARAPSVAGQVVNIATGKAITINHVIARINELLGRDISPRYQPGRPGDVKHSLADVRLSKELIGYDPKIFFDEGLKKTIDWYATIS